MFGDQASSSPMCSFDVKHLATPRVLAVRNRFCRTKFSPCSDEVPLSLSIAKEDV